MRFYSGQHRHYCGVDLHARTMYVCVLDQQGNVLVSKDIASAPEPFLELIAPYREDLAVAAECMFTWYWLPQRLTGAPWACGQQQRGRPRSMCPRARGDRGHDTLGSHYAMIGRTAGTEPILDLEIDFLLACPQPERGTHWTLLSPTH